VELHAAAFASVPNDVQAKQKLVREALDDVAGQVESKHGAAGRATFEMASVAVLAMLASQGRDVFPDQSRSYPATLARLGQAARVPENLWRPYVEGLEHRLPADALAGRLADMQNQVSDYLGGAGK
jgi:hypothetical protein